jgi:hypothetical protein
LFISLYEAPEGGGRGQWIVTQEGDYKGEVPCLRLRAILLPKKVRVGADAQSRSDLVLYVPQAEPPCEEMCP